MYCPLLTLTLLSLSAPVFAFAAAPEQEQFPSQHFIEQAHANSATNTQTHNSISDAIILGISDTRHCPEWGCGANHNEVMLSA